MTELTIRLFGNEFIGVAAGILTAVILIFGEITPKSVASVNSESIALSYSWLYIWYRQDNDADSVFGGQGVGGGILIMG